MSSINLDKIIKKIAESANLDAEEVQRRIEAKRAKLSGLISEEGAAQIVAAEVGVNFDNEKLKLDELLPGMRKVNTLGKIINIFPVRAFTTKSGQESKVCNMFLADDTSNLKMVLWDTKHIELIENGTIKQDSVVEISNASMRDNELHLGSFSEFKPSSETFDNVITEKVVKQKPIKELSISDSAKTRAFIVQSFQPRFFEINKNTGRKPTEEEKSQGVETEKRALINVVLDDGTENIRAVLFHENLPKIGLDALEDQEKLVNQREDLLGKEFYFIGNVRRNNYFNNEEFIIESVEPVELDVLSNQLED